MGKHKAIKTEQELYELFEAYKAETKAKPRVMYEFNGKDAVKCTVPLERPLTLEGFYNYCRREATTVHHYFENTEGRYAEFGGICRAIRDEIRQDQIEGGMVGQYNPSITQRLNGLKEQTDITHEGNFKLLNIDPLQDDSE